MIKLNKAIDPNVDLQPIQRPSSSLSQYFPLKDSVAKLVKSRVVYKLNCSDCDATYIDDQIEIKTTVEARPLVHNILTQSAVKQHELNNNHHIDWTNFNILAKDSKNYQLLVKESLLINSLQPNLNRTTNSVPLVVFPEGLMLFKPKIKIRSTLDSLPLVDI
ncbi:unnamed protein product [Adineta ricciae]|uniref:Uncharacterized protein n=1 Tax=Adineta ricciae TaxID=249248 RepID=A0A816F6E2_ADIRI|nr:unnamed protein product [Adineta ricciae]